LTVQEVPNPLLSKVTIGAEANLKRARSRVEEILAQKEDIAAQRLSAAELEKMAIESENEAAKLRGEPPVHRQAPDTVAKDEKEAQVEQRRQLMETGKALLDAGIDPKQVGQILLGLNPSASGGQQILASGSGVTMQDVFDYGDRLMTATKRSEADDAVTRLEKTVNDLSRQLAEERVLRTLGANKGQAPVQINPATYAREQLEALKSFADTIIDLGLAQKPGTGNTNAQDKSIEELKETHRHEEKMQQLRIDEDKSKGQIEVLSSIPERLGRGWANQMRDNGGIESNKNDGFEHIKCERCGADVIITPTTGQRVTCAKCGLVYERDDVKKPDGVKAEGITNGTNKP